MVADKDSLTDEAPPEADATAMSDNPVEMTASPRPWLVPSHASPAVPLLPRDVSFDWDDFEPTKPPAPVLAIPAAPPEAIPERPSLIERMGVLPAAAEPQVEAPVVLASEAPPPSLQPDEALALTEQPEIIPAPADPSTLSIPAAEASATVSLPEPPANVRVEPEFESAVQPRQPEYLETYTPPISVEDAPARSTVDIAEPKELWLRKGLRYALYAGAAYASLLLAALILFRFVDPPGSALMAIRWIGGTDISQSWTPIENISPNLIRAVVVAEDGTFCVHNGIDIDAMQDAIERAKDGIPRGASTISMQLTKNMFLWPSKSYVRKAIELPLTLAMELLWPKRRILEVYLNVAEWGPGVFGAQAAAQHHFDKSASSLSVRDAAQLAASLPNPFQRDAGDPGPRLQRKANVIQARMRSEGQAANCVLSTITASTTRDPD